jgi:hypothetical protein
LPTPAARVRAHRALRRRRARRRPGQLVTAPTRASAPGWRCRARGQVASAPRYASRRGGDGSPSSPVAASRSRADRHSSCAAAPFGQSSARTLPRGERRRSSRSWKRRITSRCNVRTSCQRVLVGPPEVQYVLARVVRSATRRCAVRASTCLRTVALRKKRTVSPSDCNSRRGPTRRLRRWSVAMFVVHGSVTMRPVFSILTRRGTKRNVRGRFGRPN